MFLKTCNANQYAAWPRGVIRYQENFNSNKEKFSKLREITQIVSTESGIKSHSRPETEFR